MSGKLWNNFLTLNDRKIKEIIGKPNSYCNCT
jgi:hypothetical protein